MNPANAAFHTSEKAAPVPDYHRTSGGEIDGDEKAAWLRITQILRRQDDVDRLIALDWSPEDLRWWYFIETPFTTFPRYVIGHTDAENRDPHIYFQSSAEWSAQAAWDEFTRTQRQTRIPY